MASFHTSSLIPTSIVSEPIKATIYTSPLHGQGIKANQTIQSGEIIFTEKPMYFLQTIPNKRISFVCSNCSKFLGNSQIQLDFLDKKLNRGMPEELQKFSKDLCSPCFTEQIISCRDNCGEYYCSTACQENHWKRGHQFLCTGLITEEEAEEHPLYCFKVHATMTNEIFLMVADIFAELFSFLRDYDYSQPLPNLDDNNNENKLPTKEDVALYFLKLKFSSYVKNNWYDIVTIPKGQKEKTFKNVLKNLITDTYSFLETIFNISEKKLDHIINAGLVSRLIGMFEQNNVGVIYNNPTLSYVKSLDKEDEKYDEICEKLYSIVDNIEDENCCPEDDEEEEKEDEEEPEEEEPEEDEEEQEEDQGEQEKSISNLFDEIDESTVIPPLDGTSFYNLTCRINHSCEPNVRVEYNMHPEHGLIVELKALRTIDPDEELVQSYIDQNKSYKERSAALKDYGFACTCGKCQRKE